MLLSSGGGRPPAPFRANKGLCLPSGQPRDAPWTASGPNRCACLDGLLPDGTRARARGAAAQGLGWPLIVVHALRSYIAHPAGEAKGLGVRGAENSASQGSRSAQTPQARFGATDPPCDKTTGYKGPYS